MSAALVDLQKRIEFAAQRAQLVCQQMHVSTAPLSVPTQQPACRPGSWGPAPSTFLDPNIDAVLSNRKRQRASTPGMRRPAGLAPLAIPTTTFSDQDRLVRSPRSPQLPPAILEIFQAGSETIADPSAELDFMDTMLAPCDTTSSERRPVLAQMTMPPHDFAASPMAAAVGTSCHQCKSRRDFTDLIQCQWSDDISGQRRVCKKKYCL